MLVSNCRGNSQGMGANLGGRDEEWQGTAAPAGTHGHNWVAWGRSLCRYHLEINKMS